jgi:hypothetical protein
MEEPEEHASADPEHHDSRERHSSGTYLAPYAPEPEPEGEAEYRSRSVTAALVAVALVVAVGAGGADRSLCSALALKSPPAYAG